MVSTSLAVLTLAAFAFSSTNAHGTLAKPGLKFTGTAYAGDFSATVPQSFLKAQNGDNFQHYPDPVMLQSQNAKAFDDAFKVSTYKTLKEFILKNQDMSKGRFSNPKTPECGFTDPTGGAVQTLPDQLEWYGGGMNHPGPCEVWCDNEIVVPYTANCVATYPQGKIKYDKAKCVGKNRLTLYWLSTILEWQVYIDCAKIGTGTTVAAPAMTPAPMASEASTKPAVAPAATTKPTSAPATTAKPTTAPPTTNKPASTPAASSKCKVRRD